MSQVVWYGNSTCLSVLYNHTYQSSLIANCTTCLNNGCYFCYDQHATQGSKGYCYDGNVLNCQLGTPVDYCSYMLSESTAIFLILLSIILICCICGGAAALVSCIKSSYDKTSRVLPAESYYHPSRQILTQDAYYVQQQHVVETVAIPIVSAESHPVIAHAVVIND